VLQGRPLAVVAHALYWHQNKGWPTLTLTLNVPRVDAVYLRVQERSYALVAFISQVINSVVVLLLVNAKPSNEDKNKAP